jgi:hypothetical protein
VQQSSHAACQLRCHGLDMHHNAGFGLHQRPQEGQPRAEADGGVQGYTGGIRAIQEGAGELAKSQMQGHSPPLADSSQDDLRTWANRSKPGGKKQVCT